MATIWISLADTDGIVCLPSVLGERTAADRLGGLLTTRLPRNMVASSRPQSYWPPQGSKKADLDSWLRDEFFKAHCQVFKNRPFIWHVWDGRKDGFVRACESASARAGLPSSASHTRTWETGSNGKSRAAVRDVVGADERLVAARELRNGRLELILVGDPTVRHLRSLEVGLRTGTRLGARAETTASGSTFGPSYTPACYVRNSTSTGRRTAARTPTGQSAPTTCT